MRKNTDGIATKYSDVAYSFLYGGYKQLKYYYNFTVTSKSLATPSGSKNDFISLAPYYWHPTELAASTTVSQCANCVNYAKSGSSLYKKYCNTTTNKTLPDSSNPDLYVRCDGYRNPKAASFITDND